jgi:tellurite resistance protein
VVKNSVPLLGVAISARWNHVATRRLGRTVKKYVRYRRALVHGCKQLRLESVGDPTVLIEGAWLLATMDGEAGHEEVMAMAFIMDQLSAEQRRGIELDATLGDDEEEWFELLVKTPREMHDALLDVLYLMAATDKHVQAAERRFLRRVGRALGREIDFERLLGICRHLADGDDLPPGVFHQPS